MTDHLQLALDRLSALLGTVPDKVAFSDELHFLTVDETIVGQGPDALAATIAASKEPKQMPQRIYDALTHVWPQDYADRIAKVGNALAARGLALDYEDIGGRNAGRFDLLLPAHNSRVQLRANGEAVVTGEAVYLVELGGLKADIEHVLRINGWKVNGLAGGAIDKGSDT